MRRLLMIPALVATIGVMPAAEAQSSVEGRVGKLESEMRAVQRKVFPNGAPGTLVQPDIAPVQTPTGPGPGVPASSPVADLSNRVTALEQQLSGMTGQIEQNQYKLRQLEEAFNAYKRATDARLDGGAAPGSSEAAPAGTMGSSIGGSSAGVGGPVVAPPMRPTSGSVSGKPAIDPARAQLAAAVQKPDTGDAPEDAYLYGYRLWQAKLYPEAEAQLKQVVTDYPKHRRASFAQNLLGRSYLDEGKPSLASMAFYDNYKKMPDGERAPDSLLYLGQALQKLNKPADACKVYGELTDVYSAKLSPEMKADIARNRVAAKCT